MTRAAVCIDTMGMPTKDYRGIKGPSATLELWLRSRTFRSGSSALPLLSFPARGFVLLFLRFAARVLSARNRCSSLAASPSSGCARTERIPIIRRVRAQTVEGIRSRVSRLRDRNDVPASSRN